MPFAILNWKISLTPYFLMVYISDLFLNIISLWLYFKSVSISPLSLCLPMLSFSPVFLIITSRIMLREEVSALGIVGILMVVVGSYILNISKVKAGLLEPFKSLVYEKGTRYMLIVSFIWSITANLDKHGVLMSSPLVWTFLMSFGIGFVGGVMLLLKNKTLTFKRSIILVSLADSLSALFQMIAISLIYVPYVISIKRMSIMFSSVMGYLIFKEKPNFLGILIMLLGATIILLTGTSP